MIKWRTAFRAAVAKSNESRDDDSRETRRKMSKENQFCFIELSKEFVAFPSEINSPPNFILERV